MQFKQGESLMNKLVTPAGCRPKTGEESLLYTLWCDTDAFACFVRRAIYELTLLGSCE